MILLLSLDFLLMKHVFQVFMTQIILFPRLHLCVWNTHTPLDPKDANKDIVIVIDPGALCCLCPFSVVWCNWSWSFMLSLSFFGGMMLCNSPVLWVFTLDWIVPTNFHLILLQLPVCTTAGQAGFVVCCFFKSARVFPQSIPEYVMQNWIHFFLCPGHMFHSWPSMSNIIHRIWILWNLFTILLVDSVSHRPYISTRKTYGGLHGSM